MRPRKGRCKGCKTRRTNEKRPEVHHTSRRSDDQQLVLLKVSPFAQEVSSAASTRLAFA